MQNIQVSVRCRPLAKNERTAVDIMQYDSVIRAPINGETKTYVFDSVFEPEATQIHVYKSVVGPYISQILQGFNCTVLAYGQTGTGKTFTIEGDKTGNNKSWDDDTNSGIIPRAVGHLFASIKDPDSSIIKVSFIELHNEDTYDLLSSAVGTTKLKIYDDSRKKGSVFIDGLEQIELQSADEIHDILRRGSENRKTAATLLNTCSSRSHTIFNITVLTREGIIVGKLNLVDLAGSENIARSGAQDKRAREAGSINQSLLTLGRVISALTNKELHVPYRESKLTRILRDSLGGATRTSIIATISPAEADICNTLSTLDYAWRARFIINKPESNQPLVQKKTCDDGNRESEIEFRVRNEVAVEFKRETEKMKLVYQEEYQRVVRELNQKEITIEEHLCKIDKQQGEIEDLQQLVKQLNEQLITQKEEADQQLILQSTQEKELSRLRAELSDERLKSNAKLVQLQEEIESAKIISDNQLKSQSEQFNKELKLQTQSLLDQVKDLTRELKIKEQLAEYNSLHLQRTEEEYKKATKQLEQHIAQMSSESGENKKTNRSKAIKTTAAIPIEEYSEYANITFDGGDELIQASAKKARKKIVAGAKRRAINHSITLSGKKRKLKNNDEDVELSPIQQEKTNTRVTRSRATRRKLDF